MTHPAPYTVGRDPASSRGVPASSRGVIVIADDDPALRNVLRFTMQRIGFAVEGFGDGQPTLERLRRGGVDLLITDHQMPRCSGVELLQRMVADESIDNVPTILCTAKGLELDTRNLASKFDLLSIVLKPFSPRKLGEFVSRSLASVTPSC
ncbi:response regulator [Novipirellula artificiosorum]|uniref:Chemotaxis protein CheY n=1 Tax=Novipirellula artificiosorum TaxID=2528016 RepID=A0A5C6DWB4_9BACT|nr:response regulator [Novipirellula artificiosorum]TWU40958.1 Chemotaxis protein CheY [Novipirellula artificiosorum]